MLTVSDVHFRYHRKTVIFDGFSWSLRSSRHVLLGPNGAGKSTLISLIAGLEHAQSGSISVAGTALSRNNRRKYQSLIGWMPQDIKALHGLTVWEQVAYAGWLKGMSHRAARDAAPTIIERVDLADKMDAPVASLSGGQLRRVGLAQAMVHGPSLLLLDEPTAGLDPAQRAVFRDVLHHAGNSTHVLMSTHQVDDLHQLFDQVSVIMGGQSRWEGSVADFMAMGEGDERRSEQAYLALVGGRH